MKRRLIRFLACLGAGFILFAILTVVSLHPVSDHLDAQVKEGSQPRILDREGLPLTTAYQNALNADDQRPLHRMPRLLQQAIVTSEDRHFWEHRGVDWLARLQATRQNILARRAVRGASTITEQVIRILHPRPRNLWSRWLEGWEAWLLERHASKGEILEFYLNQVPYAAQRRGVAQAARYYFDRDLTTLTPKETLALAVLPRAPSAWDLYAAPERVEPAIARLAQAMRQNGTLPPDTEFGTPLHVAPPADTIDAGHFVHWLRAQPNAEAGPDGQWHSTLNAGLQARAQTILDTRLRTLNAKNVHNAAVLIADHRTGEILAWVVGGVGDAATPASRIDAILAPRQPGSTLKPFLYALALDKGWNPTTPIEDAPLSSAVGRGLHHFTNYSRNFYGQVSLREALGNSLNVPAIHTVQFVGVPVFLDALHALGFTSLNRPIWFYDEGLALGNGEVSLFELTRAYAALANRGITRPLTGLRGTIVPKARRICSAEAASLVGNILSDPWARRLEFGYGSVLNLPVQTAVKTGTSTDYRDAWAVGYDSHFVIGVWMGNLDRTPMTNVTGSLGPAIALRSLFAELSRREPTGPLYLSPRLRPIQACLPTPGHAHGPCFPRQDYVLPDAPPRSKPLPEATQAHRILRPTRNLQLAYDPRIPSALQAFDFTISGWKENEEVEWRLDGQTIARDFKADYLWPVARGSHVVEALIHRPGQDTEHTEAIAFTVR